MGNSNNSQKVIKNRSIKLKIETSASLRKRYGMLRKNVTKRQSTAHKTIYHLNVFDGEYDKTQEPIVFDEKHDTDPVRRELESTVTDLQQRLQDTHENLTEKDQTVTNLSAQNVGLSEKITFLQNHVDALEREHQEQHEKIASNGRNNTQSSANHDTKAKDSRKVLGTMKLNQLGPDAKNKTRAAYKVKAAELNEFGANRGLSVKQLILFRLG